MCSTSMITLYTKVQTKKKYRVESHRLINVHLKLEKTFFTPMYLKYIKISNKTVMGQILYDQ